jgi:hypothetical protein
MCVCVCVCMLSVEEMKYIYIYIYLFFWVVNDVPIYAKHAAQHHPWKLLPSHCDGVLRHLRRLMDIPNKSSSKRRKESPSISNVSYSAERARIMYYET